ncbi:MAG: hypothetical protein ACXWUG_11930 [Polyangiales bacterium]
MDATGRWGGRLTSRPLPEHDSKSDGLDEQERAAVVASWLGRSAAERRAADVFEVIVGAARELDLAPELRAIAERAIDDELRHAELCRVVAEAYAGVPTAAPERLTLDVPKHEGASPELRRTIWIVQQCALNETTASAFLEACVEQAQAPIARSALRELLSDEIDHARLGWGHLASLSSAKKAEIAPWIVRIVAANVREWRKPGPHRPSERVAEHGLISPESVKRAVDDAQRTLVSPGFAHVGFEVSALNQWIDRGCVA